MGATVSTGSSEAQITANITTMLQNLVDAGCDLNDVRLIAHPRTLLHMSQLLTAGNVRAFPSIGVRGGELFGIEVLSSVGAVSSGSPSERVIVAVDPRGILVADGGITISATEQASIQLDDAPTGDSTSATATSLVSLFQAESVALKFKRLLAFQRAIDGAVAYMRVTY